jgi:hypothetical protein
MCADSERMRKDNHRKKGKNKRAKGDAGKRPAKILIMCPQNGYVFINQLTPQRFVGVGTTGITLCCFVMVTDDEFKNIFFTHADPLTALEDQQHGLPRWLETVWLIVQGNMSKMRVYVGDEPGEFYHEKVKDIVSSFSHQHPSRGSQVQIIAQDMRPAVYIVRRTAKLFPERPPLLRQAKASGFEITLGRKGAAAIHTFVRRSPFDTPRAPLCYFSGDTFLAVRDIKSQYPSAWRNYFEVTPPGSPEEAIIGVLHGLDLHLPLSISSVLPQKQFAGSSTGPADLKEESEEEYPNDFLTEEEVRSLQTQLESEEEYPSDFDSDIEGKISTTLTPGTSAKHS